MTDKSARALEGEKIKQERDKLGALISISKLN
jgi:hypothetical protein